MNKELADITVVMDRSGSMASCKAEAQNGLNHFVSEQRKLPGSAVFSLVQFDTEYEFVHTATPINQVGELTLTPRGMTALLDAVGRAINETGQRLGAMPEEQRPGLVVFVILTDGQENSSHEFTKAQIKEMIERQTNDYQWQFTFLGANQDAFAEAAGLGIPAAAAMDYDTSKTWETFSAASSTVGTMRSATRQGKRAAFNYTAEQRNRTK